MGLPAPTSTGENEGAYQNQPLIFRIGTHLRTDVNGERVYQPINVVIRDVAGEDFAQDHFPNMRERMRFFRFADEIIFMFDPVRVPEINNLLEGAIPSLPKLDTHDTEDPATVLSNLLSLIEPGDDAADATDETDAADEDQAVDESDAEAEDAEVDDTGTDSVVAEDTVADDVADDAGDDQIPAKSKTHVSEKELKKVKVSDEEIEAELDELLEDAEEVEASDEETSEASEEAHTEPEESDTSLKAPDNAKPEESNVSYRLNGHQ